MDRKEYTQVYEDYHQAIYYYVNGILKDPEASKDTLQDIFIKVWLKRREYTIDKGSMYTWLRRIAYTTVIDVGRYNTNVKRDVRLETSLNSDDTFHHPGVPEQNIDTIDLDKHLGSIEPKYANVLTTCYLHGYTREQASERLKVPTGTIKSRIKIGLRELNKIYNEEV